MVWYYFFKVVRLIRDSEVSIETFWIVVVNEFCSFTGSTLAVAFILLLSYNSDATVTIDFLLWPRSVWHGLGGKISTDCIFVMAWGVGDAALGNLSKVKSLVIHISISGVIVVYKPHICKK